jgi:hypothetical protein
MAKQPIKLFLCGFGGHGKSEAARILGDVFGLNAVDSSFFACERAVFPTLGPRYGYSSVEACYEDRRSHRKEWHDLISAYCSPADRLARQIFSEYDVYTGIRSLREFEASRHLADYSIWIDASDRLPPESIDSNQITSCLCDWVVPNNTNISDLTDNLTRLGLIIGLGPVLNRAVA